MVITLFFYPDWVANHVLARCQSPILSFTITYLPTPLLILPMEFSCFFSECVNLTDACNVPFPDYNVTSSLSILSYSSNEIQSHICNIKNNSAAGIDGITSQMLKLLPLPSIFPILSGKRGAMDRAYQTLNTWMTPWRGFKPPWCLNLCDASCAPEQGT